MFAVLVCWERVMAETALHTKHVSLGARMVDFGGWDMPLHYGSQIDEHHHVRTDCGIFDVSHMTIVDIFGVGGSDYLNRLLANDVTKLDRPGRALYGCLLNESGGVIDDLITYYLAPHRYRLVVNAATREKDLRWLMKWAESFDVELTEQKDLAMIAVQGPKARDLAARALDLPSVLDLKPFSALEFDDAFVARTGYTGEDGFEIVVANERVEQLWDELATRGASPCGLGARDTLRLEAGLNLYGSDMDENITPFECGLGWTVVLDDRDFIGADALRWQQAEGVAVKQVGLLLQGRGVMRSGQRIITGFGDGVVTSGSFSPTIRRSIALARIPNDASEVHVEIRDKHLPATIVRPPFVRRGEIKVDL